MPSQRHYVSGFFAQRGQAQDTYDELVALGIAPVHLVIYHSDSPASAPAPVADSNAVLEHVVVDAGIGTVTGTVLGGLAEIALVAANVSLFVASPMIAPLVMLGWGASLGGLIGAAKAVMDKPKSQPPGRFNDLVRDAVSAGQVVLVVQTDTDDETALARTTMQAAVGDFSDVAVAAL